jgi:hypothetical protein
MGCRKEYWRVIAVQARHSRVSGNPPRRQWTPAFAGVTRLHGSEATRRHVIPAQEEHVQ